MLFSDGRNTIARIRKNKIRIGTEGNEGNKGKRVMNVELLTKEYF